MIKWNHSERLKPNFYAKDGGVILSKVNSVLSESNISVVFELSRNQVRFNNKFEMTRKEWLVKTGTKETKIVLLGQVQYSPKS